VLLKLDISKRHGHSWAQALIQYKQGVKTRGWLWVNGIFSHKVTSTDTVGTGPGFTDPKTRDAETSQKTNTCGHRPYVVSHPVAGCMHQRSSTKVCATAASCAGSKPSKSITDCAGHLTGVKADSAHKSRSEHRGHLKDRCCLVVLYQQARQEAEEHVIWKHRLPTAAQHCCLARPASTTHTFPDKLIHVMRTSTH
jgi:hypothetical protein